MIDLVKELPHFLLLLLILQRFDDAKWGYLSECPDSKVKTETINGVFTASFIAEGRTGEETQIVFHPDIHDLYLGTTLKGRGTSVVGGRIGPVPELDRNTKGWSTENLRNDNNLAVKIYWPEERRMSEVEILKKAEEYADEIDFIKHHIPEMVCHRDPNFLCSSTKTIRKFLGLPTDSCRSLRMIAFRRLRPLRELEEKHVLTAYLECFFCKYNDRVTPDTPPTRF